MSSCLNCVSVTGAIVVADHCHLSLALLSWLTTVTGHLRYCCGWPLSPVTCAVVLADHCHQSLALLLWLTTVTGHLVYCRGWPCHRSLVLSSWLTTVTDQLRFCCVWWRGDCSSVNVSMWMSESTFEGMWAECKSKCKTRHLRTSPYEGKPITWGHFYIR